jgi:glycerol-1-phosphate dehydrogenase [NAD(P)+]
VFGDRPAHILRAEGEMAKKYSTPDEVRRELSVIKEQWPELSGKLKRQLMPFDEVRSKLKAVGAPCEPEEIGVSRGRFRETFAGVTFMRSRYFALDLVSRMGLESALSEELFGAGGVWEC